MRDTAISRGRVRHSLAAALFAGLSALAAPQPSRAQTSLAQAPPGKPILRIDPGMHTAGINQIDVDRHCTLMVTASDDKTARLWNISDLSRETPRLIRTIRPPVGPGDQGKVYAVALSPDGRWVALGGWDADALGADGHAVYIFNARTGALVKRTLEMENVILRLRFSPDGAHLGASLFGGEGMRVWNTSDWTLIASDTDYGEASSYGLAFDEQGRLWTAANDGLIRRYAPGFTAAPSTADVSGGEEPTSISVHPQGDRVAVSFGDTTAVEIYDAKTLDRQFAADTRGVDNGDLSRAVWSSDGAHLFAGGVYDDAGPNPVRVWPGAGTGKGLNLRGPANSIFGLKACGPHVAVGAADPAFGLMSVTGRRLLWQGTVKPDMRDKLDNRFTLSPDGTRVRFGLGYGAKQPVIFDVRKARLENAAVNPADFVSADTKTLAVTGWEDTTEPKLAGNALRLSRFETSRALAIVPGDKSFVLGTEWWIRRFANDGKEAWRRATPEVAWGVNVTRDGRKLVAAYGDGTVRWHRLSDGAELLALFVHTTTREWVAWTPSGYYMTSSGGEALVGWQVNRGLTKAPLFHPVGKFRARLARPDVVRRILDTLDEAAAVAAARQ